MTINKKIIAWVTLFAVTGLSFTSIASVFATSSVSGSQELHVTVMADTGKVKDLHTDSRWEEPTITYTADNYTEADIAGTGRISIIDADTGQAYFVTTKTETSWTHYLMAYTLPAVGTYHLVLHYELDDGTIIDVPFTVIYKPLPLPPSTGSIFGGGSYTYIAGYAIDNFDLAILFILIASIGLLIFFVVKHDKKDEAAKPKSPQKPLT
jgi:hypothetical protein